MASLDGAWEWSTSKVLGDGVDAVVYSGRQRATGTPVAAKVFSRSAAAHAHTAATREFGALAGVPRHPCGTFPLWWWVGCVWLCG